MTSITDPTLRAGLALGLLQDYADAHKCSVALDRNGAMGWWRARISNYPVWDNFAQDGDPLKAAFQAVLRASVAAEFKRQRDNPPPVATAAEVSDGP